MEEYGGFIVAIIFGLVMLGVTFTFMASDSTKEKLKVMLPQEKEITDDQSIASEAIDNTKMPILEVYPSVMMYVGKNYTTEQMVNKLIKTKTDENGQEIKRIKVISKEQSKKESNYEKGTLIMISDNIRFDREGIYTVSFVYEANESPTKGRPYSAHGQCNLIIQNPYIEREYITMPAQKKINLGVVPDASTQLELKYKPLDTLDGQIIGSTAYLSNQTALQFGVSISGNKFAYCFNKNSSPSFVKTAAAGTGSVYTLNLSRSVFKAGSNVTNINGPEIGSSLSQLVINGHNGEIHGCKIFKNGTIVRNLIPCVSKISHKAALWDAVNLVLYEIEE